MANKVGRPRKSLTQMSQEIGAEKKIEAVKIDGKLKPPEQTEKPAKKYKQIKVTKELVKSALTTPFTVCRALSGYEGFVISDLVIDDLVDSGYQIYLDFGLEVYSKWVNATTFSLMYGACFFGAFNGYMEEKKKQKKLEKPPEKTPDKKEPPEKS